MGVRTGHTNTSLASLLAPGGLLHEAFRNDQPVVLRDCVPVDSLPGSTQVNALIDASLLCWPYFSIVKEGIRADKELIFRGRQVRGKTIDGFMNPQGVRKALADGATLRLNAVSDWHKSVREIAIELINAFPGNGVKSFVFYTPAGQRGMLPHRDPARVVVIQVEGEKQWTLFAAPEDRNSRAGIDIDPNSVIDSFCLQPGDVLYLPHSYPHAATATSATSSHVTYTLREPTPLQLAESAISAWRSAVADGVLSKNPMMSSVSRVSVLAESLRTYLKNTDPVELVADAVADFVVR